LGIPLRCVCDCAPGLVGAHTGAPHWIVAVALLFSTELCIVLQVSLGSMSTGRVTAGVALRVTSPEVV
jgi:hypothetical protein